MSEKNNKKEESIQKPQRKRRIVIETDGKTFRIVFSQITLLELKEICRELLEIYQLRKLIDGSGE